MDKLNKLKGIVRAKIKMGKGAAEPSMTRVQAARAHMDRPSGFQNNRMGKLLRQDGTCDDPTIKLKEKCPAGQWKHKVKNRHIWIIGGVFCAVVIVVIIIVAVASKKNGPKAQDADNTVATPNTQKYAPSRATTAVADALETVNRTGAIKGQTSMAHSRNPTIATEKDKAAAVDAHTRAVATHVTATATLAATDPAKLYFDNMGGTWNTTVTQCGETGTTSSWCQRPGIGQKQIGNFRDKCKPWCEMIGHPVGHGDMSIEGTVRKNYACAQPHWDAGDYDWHCKGASGPDFPKYCQAECKKETAGIAVDGKGDWNPAVKKCGQVGTDAPAWCQRAGVGTQNVGDFRDKCKGWCKSVGAAVP